MIQKQLVKIGKESVCVNDVFQNKFDRRRLMFSKLLCVAVIILKYQSAFQNASTRNPFNTSGIVLRFPITFMIVVCL